MEQFRIADLNVAFRPQYQTMRAVAAPYAQPFDGPADLTLRIPDGFFEQQLQKTPGFSLQDLEYIWSGARFHYLLPRFQGFMLHAAAVSLDGQGYLFSAPCGTGKSTHASLWTRKFGPRAFIFNDDKPSIRLLNGRFYAYGTPWCGKDYINQNVRVPLRGIAFLERAAENSIARIPSPQAVKLLLWQTNRPADRPQMTRLLDLFETLLKTVPVFRLRCNTDDGAVQCALNALMHPDGCPFEA